MKLFILCLTCSRLPVKSFYCRCMDLGLKGSLIKEIAFLKSYKFNFRPVSFSFLVKIKICWDNVSKLKKLDVLLDRTTLNYMIGRVACTLRIFWSYAAIRSAASIHLLQGTPVHQPLSAESDNVSCSAVFLSTVCICPLALKWFNRTSQVHECISPD